DGHAEGLSVQIPERDVDSGECREQDRPAAPERAAKHILPDVLDPGRILALQVIAKVVDRLHRGLFPGVDRCFTQADQPIVSRNFDKDVLTTQKWLNRVYFHLALAYGLSSGLHGQSVRPRGIEKPCWRKCSSKVNARRSSNR